MLYIAAGALAACRPRLEPLVPTRLVPMPADSAAAWARRTVPDRPVAIRFRWRYQDERVRWAGRGTARIAPPDSLRLDYAGPLGLGAGAAVVIGDSVAWAEPSGSFRTLVPAVRMLWAALGTVRPPAAGTVWAGLAPAPDQRRRVWRFVDGPDTLDYVLSEGASLASRLEAEWRRGETVVARSRTTFAADRVPGEARIDFPEAPARFEITVVGVDTGAVVPPALWRSRR